MTIPERARRAVQELLDCYREARDVNERERVCELISCLSPQGCISLAEMGEKALRLARQSDDDRLRSLASARQEPR